MNMKSRYSFCLVLVWLICVNVSGQDASKDRTKAAASDSSYIRLSADELIQLGRLSAVIGYGDTLNNPITGYMVTFYVPHKKMRLDGVGTKMGDRFPEVMVQVFGKLEPGTILTFDRIETRLGRRMLPVKVRLK